MKKPIDPNLERFEDSVFSLTGGDDTSGVSYRAPQFEMKETSAAATPGEYHASENHRQAVRNTTIIITIATAIATAVTASTVGTGTTITIITGTIGCPKAPGW
jgi:hypothetical protein